MTENTKNGMTIDRLVIPALKGEARWFPVVTDETVPVIDSFLEEHDFELFESWVGFKEGGMSFESLNFIRELLIVGTESTWTLNDGSVIEFVEVTGENYYMWVK